MNEGKHEQPDQETDQPDDAEVDDAEVEQVVPATPEQETTSTGYPKTVPDQGPANPQDNKTTAAGETPTGTTTSTTTTPTGL